MTARELLSNRSVAADVSSASITSNIIRNYPAWEGSKILNILMQYPNTPIYSSVLETALQMRIPLPEAQASIYHLAPVKMTDETTLKAVKKRLNQLIAIVGADPCVCPTTGKHGGLPLQDNYAAEIRALTQYIKETTLPTGGIKCFHDEDRAAYRRQSAAIRRLLAQAAKDGHHEAVAYIKHHLFQGKQMRWEE